MLIPIKIKTRWTGRVIEHYKSKGYEFTKFNDVLYVHPLDLPSRSHEKVFVMCDFCLREGKTTVFLKEFFMYSISREKSYTKMDCCSECSMKKIMKTKRTKGAKNGYAIKKKRDAIKRKKEKEDKIVEEIDLDSLSPRQRKFVETSLKKYGVTHPMKCKEFKEKLKKTNQERYGGNSPTNSPEIRRKQLDTMIEKYGVEYNMQNQEIKEKARQTLYENNTAPTSRQQLYMHSIIGGELNYPVKNYSLDIAFLGEKIYVECNFGGHWLQIKLGSVTEEEFKNEERKRWYFFNRQNWKDIRINSSKDKVPTDSVVLDMIAKAKKIFNEEGRSWVEFDLDEGKIKTSQYIEDYDFGELINVSKRD